MMIAAVSCGFIVVALLFGRLIADIDAELRRAGEMPSDEALRGPYA